MTRSVEIPDEAVEAGARANTIGRWEKKSDEVRSMHLNRMRAALEAALPYLAPAKVCSCRTVAPSGWDRVVDVTDPGCVIHGEPAPAGDGGLREALERLAVKWEAMDTPGLAAPSNQQWAEGVDCGYNQAADDLRMLLAAHPAAPAVPQPADRTRHAIWRAVYDAATEQGLQPSGIADKATEAVLALSAQPVDREALRAHLLKAEVVRADGGYWDTPTPQEAGRMADAVLAVLAGEQEQVEK